MGRYRKILVAVDGSESSKNAFRQACKLAPEDKSWLTVITVIPLYQDQFDVLSTKEKVSKRLRDEGEKILSDIKNIADEEDIFIKTLLEEGTPFQRIIDIADEGGYDLIVMGRRGLHRLERAFIGSVTARVIGYSHTDVLVIPKDTTVDWQRILIAVDGSKYSKAAAERAIDFIESYGGEIKVLSVVDVPAELYAESPKAVEDLINKAKGYVEDVKKQSDAKGIKTETFVREGDAYQVIVDIAREQNVNTIIMGSHGRTGIKRLLMGSVTEGVIGYAPCPVLVVKA